MKPGYSRIKSVCSAMIVTVTTSTTPVAAEPTMTLLTTTSQSASSVAGQGAVRFDWLAKRSLKGPARPVRVSGKRRAGGGKWVCSPAGFGKKSRCARR